VPEFFQCLSPPRGAITHGTILVYGNEPVLVTTRGLVLEKAGYQVFTAQAFGNAMLVLMHHQIDACVLCQSLTDEERRGILETARALQSEIRCAVLDFAESEVAIEGVDLIRGLVGPSSLLNTVGKLLTQSLRPTNATRVSHTHS
jgi:DNA-binding response OmpR family regulator